MPLQPMAQPPLQQLESQSPVEQQPSFKAPPTEMPLPADGGLADTVVEEEQHHFGDDSDISDHVKRTGL